MEKITTFDLGKSFDLPNPGLLAYFRHVDEGSPNDIRTPFWGGAPREKILSAWSDIFESLNVDQKMPGLKAFELEMRGKVGPLSIMAPLKARIESIEEYYKAIEIPSVPIDPRAIESFKRTLKGVRIQLTSWENTVSRMRLSTNSGAPYFTRRRRVVHDTLDEMHDPFWKGNYRALSPAVLGWRGQEGGPTPDDVKQRVVWMFPFSINIWELSFYNAAIRDWQSRNINSAFISMRAVEEKITKLFATKGDEYVVVTDFTKFDQHFNLDCQNAAKEIISHQLYENANKEWWLEDIFPYKYNIPLVCDTELMYTGHHGMGSGSGGTNFDEDCTHGAMQHEVAILNGSVLNPYSNAYGDDGYLSYKGIDVDQVISAYTSHGQVMNPDKQSVDKHSMIYLRRYYHDSYRDNKGIMLGVYSTFRALGRLMGQERYIPFVEGTKDYARYSILRSYGIIENCANSPVFEEFVDFVISGDKYRLGLDLPGFLDSLDKEVEEAIENDPGLLGYTKTLQDPNPAAGINNWKIVKYLRSKQ